MKGFRRWWLATLWLWLMAIGNSVGAAVSAAVLLGYLHVSRTAMVVQLYAFAGMAAQIVCVIAIFRWHRWGWWGLLVLGCIFFLLNVALVRGPIVALSGIAGVGTCYFVLKGGGQAAVWPRLK